jgi:hypothetical protein
MHEDAKIKAQNSKVMRRENKRRVSNANGHIADWGTVDPQLIVRAIETVARKGGALRFGYTRDGGAYAIGVLGDGDPYTDYVKPSDDVGGYLEGLIGAWLD